MNLKFLLKKNSTALALLLSMGSLVTSINAQYYPASDPTNTDGWILNNEVSDEFNGTELNKNKWWILGENGEYRSKWKGRAPGQFVPHNVEVVDGELKLYSKWEPDFDFINEQHDGTWYGGSTSAADNSKPITQSCILSERMFKYGYMEVRCKDADAPVTSAFWATGYRSEIDMTENYGKRPIPRESDELERKYRTNVINWSPGFTGDQWKVEQVLDHRVAADYSVYGFEWDKDFIKIYYNGELLQEASRSELEATNNWSIMHPMELWLDAEVFSWYGLPSQADLATPSEFNIDYVRIWQKEDQINGPYFNALGFEGPFYFSTSADAAKRSQQWYPAGHAHYMITEEKSNSGDCSLVFEHDATLTANQTLFSPDGSIDLPTGSNEISLKVWVEPTNTIQSIRIILENPWSTIDIPLPSVTEAQWVDLSKTFSRSDVSASNDRMRIQIRSGQVGGASNKIYIDDITFENENTPVLELEASFSADATTGEAPLVVQFTDETEGMPTAWEWDFDNDGTVDSNERNPSYTYDTPGTYSVMLTVTNDNGTDTKLIENYITVEEETSTKRIDASLVSIYPNPTSGIMNLACTQADQIKIYNTAGILVHQVMKESEPQQINISDLHKGVYVISLLSNKNIIFTDKLVVL